MAEVGPSEPLIMAQEGGGKAHEEGVEEKEASHVITFAEAPLANEEGTKKREADDDEDMDIMTTIFGCCGLMTSRPGKNQSGGRKMKRRTVVEYSPFEDCKSSHGKIRQLTSSSS